MEDKAPNMNLLEHLQHHHPKTGRKAAQNFNVIRRLPKNQKRHLKDWCRVHAVCTEYAVCAVGTAPYGLCGTYGMCSTQRPIRAVSVNYIWYVRFLRCAKCVQYARHVGHIQFLRYCRVCTAYAGMEKTLTRHEPNLSDTTKAESETTSRRYSISTGYFGMLGWACASQTCTLVTQAL